MRSPPNEGCFLDSPRIHCATGACTSGACSTTGLNRTENGELRSSERSKQTVEQHGTTQKEQDGINRTRFACKKMNPNPKKNSSLGGLEPSTQEISARSASHCATRLSCRPSYGRASIPTEMLPRKICFFQLRLPSEAWVRLG